MLPFSIQFQDGVPVSDQILRAVRKAVLTGQLVEGEGFPSVRAMSQALKVSPTTAHKVVSQLKAAGYLASRPGIGMVVTRPSLPAGTSVSTCWHRPAGRSWKRRRSSDLTLEDVQEALRRTHENSIPTTRLDHETDHRNRSTDQALSQGPWRSTVCRWRFRRER